MLSDGEERHVTAVCLFCECSRHQMNHMVEAGLIRVPDIVLGGKKVCITPRGTEYLTRFRKKEAEKLW